MSKKTPDDPARGGRIRPARPVDRLALLVLVLVLASAGTAATTGSPVFLLAREGLITAALGVVVLGSPARPRPAMYEVGRTVSACCSTPRSGWCSR